MSNQNFQRPTRYTVSPNGEFERIPCNHEGRKDLTHGKGEIRNIYCPECGWHLYKGKEYTKAEWFAYVNNFS